MNRMILASASPRRRELLQQIGYTFEIIPALGEEKVTDTRPDKAVEALSLQKATEVFEGLEEKEDTVVIGADTVVAYNGMILGKPPSVEEACRMLGMLQGNSHQVYTGVTLCACMDGESKVRTFHECTEVTFYPMTEAEIAAYVEGGEPMDKAGAYGIQGQGAVFVERIAGDYSNVVGLPLAKLYREIKAL